MNIFIQVIYIFICFPYFRFLKIQNMISILIPIYNISVCELVHCVHKQAVALNIPFEIILIDDNSEQQWKETNKQLSSLQNVEYKELTENIGRAKIRNLLADTSQYSYLLFLDSDVKIYSEQFLQTYITHCQPNSVVYGGMLYDSMPPSPQQRLRWNYGRKKECLSAKQRQKNQYKSFNSINFLIDKHVFDMTRFNETISTYGHEDTLFGFQLEQMHIPILHIDNQVLHINTATNKIFIEQNKQAVENLYKMYRNSPKKTAFRRNIKLLRLFHFLEQLHLVNFVAACYTKHHERLLQHIEKYSSLRLLNILKISYLCFISKHYAK